MVAFQCVDSLGVAQRPPLVPLMRVGLGQQFKFVCDVLVEVITFGLRGLGTDPLPRYWLLSSSIWTKGEAGARSLLFGVLASDESFQITLRDAVFFSSFFLFAVWDCLRAGCNVK